MAIFSAITPVSNKAALYVNRLEISLNATTPNTKIDVNAGACRDSTNTYDIVVGNYEGAVPNSIIPANSITTINGAVNGINGLDTGTLAASTMYYIHAIFDNTMKLPSGLVLSLSLTAPLLPAGYSSFRWIGQWTTDSSVHFLAGYNYGTGTQRLFFYDAVQSTGLDAGSSTTYSSINLVNLVPAIDNIPVWLVNTLTPGAASRVLNVRPTGSAGDALTVIGQVAAVPISSKQLVNAKLSSSAPSIQYKVTNAGDVAAVQLAGFYYSL